MRHLHFEQVGGVSGDMLLGALVGLGVDPGSLESALRSLGLPGLSLRVRAVERNGAPATRVEVLIDGRPADPHDHGHAHGHAHSHDAHSHGHAHSHDTHSHGQAHSHEHRRLRDIEAMIDASSLPDAVRRDSLAIFRRLAEAEAAVHGTSVEEVHFHEVGAVDSIADVVGAVWSIHHLEVDRVTGGPFVLGRGEVAMAHGRWPVPAPATVRLIEGLPVRFVDLEGETVTPTGAAVLSSLATFVLDLPVMTLERSSAGAGGREWPDRPNILRAFLGVTEKQAPVAGTRMETIAVLGTQIDDMTPQGIADLADRLMEAGALDVTVTPLLMKKGRPGFGLSVYSSVREAGRMATLLLTVSSTLGVRVRMEERHVLARRVITVATRWGPVRVKVTHRPDGTIEGHPEFDDCQEISHRAHKSLHYVVEEARRAAAEALGGPENPLSGP
ncbi:MAG TPA: nickel pincer cofactor biosynthesis protein LarC [Candidatus Eisenbacteria bacterium]